MSSSPKDKEHVFVILRADLFHPEGTSLETVVSPKEVVRSEELAQREVARLNALHPDGQVRYWYAISRLFPPGLSAGSSDVPA
jgi:hypothetical protein